MPRLPARSSLAARRARGCATPGCPGRLWERLFCPHCDGIVLGPPSLIRAASAAFDPLCAGVGAARRPLSRRWKLLDRPGPRRRGMPTRRGPAPHATDAGRAQTSFRGDAAAIATVVRKRPKALADLQAQAAQLKAKPPARPSKPPAQPPPRAAAVEEVDPQLGQETGRATAGGAAPEPGRPRRAKPADNLSHEAWQDWIENSSIGFAPAPPEQAEAARRRAQGFGKPAPESTPKAAKEEPKAKPANAKPDGDAWEDWVEGTSWS